MKQRGEGDPHQTITAPTPPQGRVSAEKAPRDDAIERREGDRGQIVAPTPPQARVSVEQVPLSGLEVVDLNDPENVKYWCQRWRVSQEQLREAVERGGGNDSPTVSLALGLEAP